MAIEIQVVFRAKAILSRIGVNLKHLYKTPPARNTLLAQKQPSKQANGCKFGFGAFLFQSNFEHATYIQHHFAFLVCCRFMFLAAPNCCFLPCIQRHVELRFAPFYLAFSGKTHCIQRHIAVHLAPKRTLFCTKTQCIQEQTAQKQVQMVVCLNKNSFCRTHRLTLFCIETNLRENRFFAARCAIGE